jgi:hypothetical protein
VPELSYEGLEIGEGATATIRFEEMVRGSVVGDDAEAVRRHLIDYCRLDTLAMVKIVEKLQEIAR